MKKLSRISVVPIITVSPPLMITGIWAVLLGSCAEFVAAALYA